MAFRSSLAGSECMEIGKEELNCGLLAQMHNVNATMFDRYGDADDFLDISGDDTCLLRKKKSAPLSFISNKVRSWLPSYANWATLRKEICGVGSVHGMPVAEQKNPFVIRPVTQMSKTGCR